MSAKARIEGLTNAWYGFAVFTTILSVLRSGFGIISLALTAVVAVVYLCVTFFIGRRLLARSSFMRSILLVVSVVWGLLGAYGCFRYGTAFLSQWSFGLLLNVVAAGASVMMNIRSFRVLTESSVKSYFG